MDNIDLNQSYEELLKSLPQYNSLKEAQAKGYEAHHIVPISFQRQKLKEDKGITLPRPAFLKSEYLDDRCVRCTALEHLILHYALAKQYGGDYIRVFTLMYNRNSYKIIDLSEIGLENLQKIAALREEGRRITAEKNREISNERYKNHPEIKQLISERTKIAMANLDPEKKRHREEAVAKMYSTEEGRRLHSERTKEGMRRSNASLKLRIAKTGKPNLHPMCQEERDCLSKERKGKPRSSEDVQRMRDAQKQIRQEFEQAVAEGSWNGSLIEFRSWRAKQRKLKKLEDLRNQSLSM